MNQTHVEAVDMSRWIDEALNLSDEFVAALEKRAHLESSPMTRAMFSVTAAFVLNFRVCSTGPHKDEKGAAMVMVMRMIDPLTADLRRACEERAAKAN